MMNNTYSMVISQSERAWSFQWARTLFALERRLSDEEKLLYLKKYAINISNKTTTSSTTTTTSTAGAPGSSRPGTARATIGSDAETLDETRSVSSLALNARELKEQLSHGQTPTVSPAPIATQEQFVPGLMIIKQTNCTKAELRRKIIGHWQVSR